MPPKRKKQLVGTGDPCALCGDKVSGSEGRCLFSAIQAYLYQTVPGQPTSGSSTCLSLLAGKVNFRGIIWDIHRCPPDTEDSKSLVVHGRCQAVIRREAAKVNCLVVSRSCEIPQTHNIVVCETASRW